MWFRFPKGVSGISVQQQEFGVEATDDKGAYFRAPDHFAGLILDLPGFAAAEPSGEHPEDLPKADPLRDGAITQLTAQVARLELERDSALASLAEVGAMRDEFKRKAMELETQVKNLEADLEEERALAPSPSLGSKK